MVSLSEELVRECVEHFVDQKLLRLCCLYSSFSGETAALVVALLLFSSFFFLMMVMITGNCIV